MIADFEITERMLRYFILKIHRRRYLARPRVVVCVPSGITGVERRAVIEASSQAGARQVHIIEEPMAAAIGAGLPVHEATGNMVVDIGGGTTEVAVISLGGIVTAQSIRVAGDELDNAIVQHIKKEYSLLLGERSAEQIKMSIGSAFALEGEKDEHAEIRGRDLVSGLPKTVVISAAEVREAIDEPVNSIIDAVKTTLDQCPPELMRRRDGPRHRAHRRRRPAARPGRAAAPGDRHADPHRREPARLGRAGLRQVRRGVRGAPAGAGRPAAALSNRTPYTDVLRHGRPVN